MKGKLSLFVSAVLIILLSTSTCYAKGFYTAYFRGIYAGVEVGGLQGYFRERTDSQSTILTSFAASGAVTEKSTAIWGVNAGFSATLSRLYLGFNFDGTNGHSSTLSDETCSSSNVLGGTFEQDGKIATELKDVYGFSFKPGIVLTPRTVLYGVIGAQAARLTASVVTDYSSSIVTQIISTVDEVKRVSALRLGMGILHYVTPHLVFGLEYDHTQYKETRLTSFAAVGANNVRATTIIHPKTNMVLFMADWYFLSGKSHTLNQAQIPLHARTTRLCLLPSPSKPPLKLPKPSSTDLVLPSPN